MAYAKTERSAAQIVAAATRVLARQGYARTSLLDIAREAGMSKGALHYHFPSKESLVSRVLESALESIANRTLDAWIASSGDPIQALRSSVTELWFVRRTRTDEVAVVADLMAQALYDESLKPQLAGYFRFAAQQVTQTLVPHLALMGLRLRVPGELVPRILVGLLDGLAMQHYVDPGAIDENGLLVAVEAMAAGLFEIVPPASDEKA
ncbi:MAG: TetR/AcrR family transcriptional regulator [Deltaproteobacteria bacterium]|nr:TetR/AcrR family transcriptional regulator [Deltaproteobacteria bacterium]